MFQFRALGTSDIPCHPGASHSVVNNVEIGQLLSYNFLVSSVEDCLCVTWNGIQERSVDWTITFTFERVRWRQLLHKIYDSCIVS